MINSDRLWNLYHTTGLMYVMGGDKDSQYHALQKFAMAVVKDALDEYKEAHVALPDGLPKPNQRVAIVDKSGKPDICAFVTVSDGTWFWDNGIDCIYQYDEVKEWKAI
jgi:hypothetical protein